MLNDKKIPNLASKFKHNNIWPPFGPKNNGQIGCVENVESTSCGKLTKLGILPVLTVFFYQNGCQMLFYLRFETTFGIFS